MDVLPTPILEDLHLIIPGVLRRELSSVTISMTPDEYAIVQQHATEKVTAERDHAIEQASAANAQVQQLSATNMELAQKVTGLEMQLDTGTSDALQVMKAQLTALERELAGKTDQLATANKTITGQQVTNDKQSDLLRDALARLAKYEPTTIPPSTIPAPPIIPAPVIGDLPGFATYLTDSAGSGAKRTADMTGYADRLAAAGIKEFVLFLNDAEIDDGDIPDYLDRKALSWWADTFQSVYKVQMAKVARDKAAKIPLDKIPDYFGESVIRCDLYRTHRGYVLDDAQNLNATEFEAQVAAIRKHSQKPIVASFGVLEDLNRYLPTINKHHIFIARQLYRHEMADAPQSPAEDTPTERTIALTNWLTKKGMICHIGNLEYFKEGTQVTRGDDLRYMYNRCIDAGLKSFMGYAAVDVGGFKIWDHPDLWAAFKECAAAFPEKVKIAVPA